MIDPTTKSRSSRNDNNESKVNERIQSKATMGMRTQRSFRYGDDNSFSTSPLTFIGTEHSNSTFGFPQSIDSANALWGEFGCDNPISATASIVVAAGSISRVCTPSTSFKPPIAVVPTKSLRSSLSSNGIGGLREGSETISPNQRVPEYDLNLDKQSGHAARNISDINIKMCFENQLQRNHKEGSRQRETSKEHAFKKQSKAVYDTYSFNQKVFGTSHNKHQGNGRATSPMKDLPREIEFEVMPRFPVREEPYEHYSPDESFHCDVPMHIETVPSQVTTRIGTVSPQLDHQPAQVYINLGPGVSAPIRHAEEMKEAVSIGFYVPCRCICCDVQLFCITDADFVLCPQCSVVGPIAIQRTRCSPALGRALRGGGVCAGVTVEGLRRIKQTLAARKNRDFF